MINSIVLTGRIVRNPELRYLPSVERQIIALTNCITRSKYSYKIKIT